MHVVLNRLQFNIFVYLNAFYFWFISINSLVQFTAGHRFNLSKEFLAYCIHHASPWVSPSKEVLAYSLRHASQMV